MSDPGRLSHLAVLMIGGFGLLLLGRPLDLRTTPPNVLLISVDSLRRDRLSTYGYSRPTSPWLDQLAADGIRFDRIYNTGGFTLPSHMSLMTSMDPEVHGVTESSGLGLDDDRTSLAEVLRAAGYRTAAFVDGGWMSGQFGFGQGFETYDDQGGGLASTIPRAEAWWSATADPSFVFLHTYDVHSSFHTFPYECPATFLYKFETSDGALSCKDGRCASDLLTWINDEVEAGRLEASRYLTAREQQSLSRLYDGCLAYADARIGVLLDWLRTTGRYARTLIVVLADHGEEFLDHGHVGHSQEGYEEIVGIPLIMKLPRQEYAGRRVSALGAMIDVMPTILELTHQAPPREAQGVSLMPAVITGQSVRDAVRSGDTLITRDWEFTSVRQQLFAWSGGRASDGPNRFAEEPEVVDKLNRILRAAASLDTQRRAELRARSSRTVPMDDTLRTRLHALGYLQ